MRPGWRKPSAFAWVRNGFEEGSRYLGRRPAPFLVVYSSSPPGTLHAPSVDDPSDRNKELTPRRAGSPDTGSSDMTCATGALPMLASSPPPPGTTRASAIAALGKRKGSCFGRVLLSCCIYILGCVRVRECVLRSMIGRWSDAPMRRRGSAMRRAVNARAAVAQMISNRIKENKTSEASIEDPWGKVHPGLSPIISRRGAKNDTPL